MGKGNDFCGSSRQRHAECSTPLSGRTPAFKFIFSRKLIESGLWPSTDQRNVLHCTVTCSKIPTWLREKPGYTLHLVTASPCAADPHLVVGLRVAMGWEEVARRVGVE